MPQMHSEVKFRKIRFKILGNFKDIHLNNIHSWIQSMAEFPFKFLHSSTSSSSSISSPKRNEKKNERKKKREGKKVQQTLAKVDRKLLNWKTPQVYWPQFSAWCSQGKKLICNLFLFIEAKNNNNDNNKYLLQTKYYQKMMMLSTKQKKNEKRKVSQG